MASINFPLDLFFGIATPLIEPLPTWRPLCPYGPCEIDRLWCGLKSIQQRPIREGGGVGVGGGCGAIATTQHYVEQEQITTANVTHMYLDRYDEFWDGDGSAGGHD